MANDALPLQAPANPATTLAADKEAMQDVLRDRLIQDEYKVWKKNSPFLYDSVVSTALEWPSLTCQFLPTVKREGDLEEHQMLLGTHTGDSEQNYLMLGSIMLSEEGCVMVEGESYDESRGEVGGFGAGVNGSGSGGGEGKVGKIDIKVKIKHEGEVNRAR